MTLVYEKTLHELAAREPDVAFPGLGFRIIGNGTALPSGILDLLAVDASGETWVIELKRNSLGRTAVDQVLRYLSELIERSPEERYRAMIAGPECSTQVRAYASEQGVVVHVFDMAAMAELGRRLGVRDMDAAPKRIGSSKRESKTRGPGKRRADSGLQEERQRIQRGLDHAFPPGSLTHGVDPATLETYWQTACPNAAAAGVAMTVTITLHVLDQARGTALSNRATRGRPSATQTAASALLSMQAREGPTSSTSCCPRTWWTSSCKQAWACATKPEWAVSGARCEDSDAESALKTPSVGLTADSKPTIPELGPTIDRISLKPPEVRKPGLASQRHTRGGPANRASARSH